MSTRTGATVEPVVTPLLAHAKWFVEEPSSFDQRLGFVADPVTIALLVVALAGAVVWRLISKLLPAVEVRLPLLARLAPWVPRILGVHLGVKLLSLAVEGAYLAPHLSLEGVPGGSLIALAEGVVGVWLVTGWRLRPAAVATIALGPLGLVLAGPVSVLEAADVLGLALFLAWLPPGPDAWGRRDTSPDELRPALLSLRLALGSALIVVAFTEKLLAPELTLAFLDRYPAFDLFSLLGLDLGPETFVRFAAAVEILFGLLIISGASPQAVVVVAGIPFNATLFFLGREELIGHLAIYGALLALLVYGSTPGLADIVPDLRLRPCPQGLGSRVSGASTAAAVRPPAAERHSSSDPSSGSR